MIEFDCVACGERLASRDGDAGKRITCRHCGAKMTAPPAIDDVPAGNAGAWSSSWHLAAVASFAVSYGAVGFALVDAAKDHSLLNVTVYFQMAITFGVLSASAALIGRK